MPRRCFAVPGAGGVLQRRKRLSDTLGTSPGLSPTQRLASALPAPFSACYYPLIMPGAVSLARCRRLWLRCSRPRRSASCVRVLRARPACVLRVPCACASCVPCVPCACAPCGVRWPVSAPRVQDALLVNEINGLGTRPPCARPRARRAVYLGLSCFSPVQGGRIISMRLIAYIRRAVKQKKSPPRWRGNWSQGEG